MSTVSRSEHAASIAPLLLAIEATSREDAAARFPLLLDLAVAHFELEQYDAALANTTAALSVDPLHPKARSPPRSVSA